jgi:RNA polymerase sigma-70 factor (ECF subfamily)
VLLAMSLFQAPVPESLGSTSSSLLQRVAAHQPEAWQRMAQLHCPLVYRWAREQGLQDADAADVVQEVFRTVFARIDGFHRDKPGDSFRGWLWTITRNKLGDHFRRVAARPNAAGGSDAHQQFQQLQDVPAEDSANPGALDVDTGLLHGTLELIRPDFEHTTWQAFWRATVDGHAAADIARDLGMTAHAVRQARYRVLQRLRKELDDLQGC